MSKQDGCSPRTAVDLERKFNFGTAFQEFTALIAQAQKTADAANSAYGLLDQKHIVDLLTNGGEASGIYTDKAGNVLFDADCIKRGLVGDAFIPSTIARANAIPGFLSQLQNDMEYVDAAGVEAIVNGMTLSYSNLPSGIALSSEIPMATSELTNDSGFITSSEATTIANNAISASTVISALTARVQALETTVQGLTARLEALENASTET